MEHLKIIEQALNAANKAGVFTLQESAAIAQAIFLLAKDLQKENNVKEEFSSKKNK